jgi:hypothetical protein
MDMDLLDYLQHCRESSPLRRSECDALIEEEPVDESERDGKEFPARGNQQENYET